MCERESTGNTGSPCGAGAVRKPELREEAAGPLRVADRSVVVMTPGNAGRAKGPWFKVSVRSGDSQEIGVSLLPPEKVEKLQTALHAKAKRSPDYRFHQLYDKVYRADVLWFAHRRCRFNDGAAGVDGLTFDDIEAYGVKRWLGELAEELRNEDVSSRVRSVGCRFPNRMANSDRWAFRRSKIVSCRWRQ